MGKKVLVVDDEKLIVKGLSFSLEQDDMEVRRRSRWQRTRSMTSFCWISCFPN